MQVNSERKVSKKIKIISPKKQEEKEEIIHGLQKKDDASKSKYK